MLPPVWLPTSSTGPILGDVAHVADLGPVPERRQEPRQRQVLADVVRVAVVEVGGQRLLRPARRGAREPAGEPGRRRRRRPRSPGRRLRCRPGRRRRAGRRIASGPAPLPSACRGGPVALRLVSDRGLGHRGDHRPASAANRRLVARSSRIASQPCARSGSGTRSAASSRRSCPATRRGWGSTRAARRSTRGSTSATRART